MMAIVIKHCNAIVLARAREAPLHPGKALQPFTNRFITEAKLMGHSQRCRRIQGVVIAGHCEGQAIYTVCRT